MLKSSVRVLFILVVAFAAGAVNLRTRFPNVAWIAVAGRDYMPPEQKHETHITLAQFKDFVSRTETERILIIDAREPAEFSKGHVPAHTIINIPEDHAHEHVARVLENFATYQIVLYCTSSTCDAAEKVYMALQANGLTDMLIYPDGWKGWTDARLPTLSGRERRDGIEVDEQGMPIDPAAEPAEMSEDGDAGEAGREVEAPGAEPSETGDPPQSETEPPDDSQAEPADASPPEAPKAGGGR